MNVTTTPARPPIVPQPPPGWWAAGLALHEREDTLDRAVAAGLAEPGADPRKATATELADWTPAPEWAGFVEQVLAEPTSGSPRPEVTPADGVTAFAVPLRHLAEAAWALANSGGRTVHALVNGLIDADAVRSAWVESLGRQLGTIAARTMVLELNLARLAGRLRGETPEDRFVDFVLRTDTPAGLRALLYRYPVLARLLGQTCLHAAAAQRELLDRFAADRADLVVTLLAGRDPGPLVAVERGLGDPHDHGRTVTVLHFADGAAVVHKPRPLDGHQHFADLLRTINDRAPRLGLRAPALVVRDGYGWQEFVPERPCADLAEVDRFYRRYGALLGLVWTLGGTDVHCENLIADADQPVVIDLETLFHPGLQPQDDDPAGHELLRSVYRTAMLPQFVAGRHGVLDLSGLGGDRDTTVPVDCVGWADAGTDTMRLIRTTRPFAGARNRPRLDGEEVDPHRHQSAILDGFRTALDALGEAAAAAGGPAELLAPFAADPMRVLVRPTRVYASMLDESTHPDVLRDGLDREAVFGLLWARSAGDPVRLRLVAHELRALWAGDVPAFTTRPESRSVWSADGAVEPDLLPAAGLDTAREMVHSDEITRHDQEWLIRATIAARSSVVDHRGGEPAADRVQAVADTDTVLSSASGIGDEIIARACHRAGVANWLGLQAVDERYWAVLPMGATLGDGYLGVALFLAQLGALTDEARYTALARSAVRGVNGLLSRLGAGGTAGAPVHIGAFHGLGGVCYTLARLATLLEDEALVAGTDRAVALLRDSVEASDRWDVSTGRAGALVALTAVHQELGLAEAGAVAGTLAEELTDYQDYRPAPAPGEAPNRPRGFLCGQAGIGWALTRYGTVLRDESGVRAGHRVLADELDAEDGYGWCRGVGGVLLAALRSGLPGATEALHPERLIAQPPTEDMSVCHGGLGVVEVLSELERHGSAAAATQRQRRTAALLADIEVSGPRCGTPGGVASPGLLTGLSGIGYGLLRLAYRSRVPSVLTLDTPADETSSAPDFAAERENAR
jgi:type 2 lantibiotic biosynthesis protein LanM